MCIVDDNLPNNGDLTDGDVCENDMSVDNKNQGNGESEFIVLSQRFTEFIVYIRLEDKKDSKHA